MTSEPPVVVPDVSRVVPDVSRVVPAPPGPEALFVVSSAEGFVGAFLSPGAAGEATLGRFPSVPFVVQRFPLAPGPREAVWCVLYKGDCSAIAFASNDRAEAVRVQEIYARIGAVYDDDIDHWEAPVGRVAEPIAERLGSLHRAHVMYGAGPGDGDLQKMEKADLARLEELSRPRADGPLARLFRELELVTIMDCVVPVALAPPASADADGGEPRAADEESRVVVDQNRAGDGEPERDLAPPPGEARTAGGGGEGDSS
jgi:hypothetical protein